jgi:hypothetical protein
LVPLASLLDTSLSDPFGLCPLRPTEVTSLRKLASLWNRIVEQFLPLAERNRERLGPIFERLNADGFVSHKPFLAEWPLLALTSQTLREKGSPDAGEVRNLLNGLHESALLASLLGSFGIGPFTSRAFSKVEAALTPESSLPAYAARFYRHRLTIDALSRIYARPSLVLSRMLLNTPKSNYSLKPPVTRQPVLCPEKSSSLRARGTSCT